MFQFTHPCGCDGMMDNLISGIPGFNSRTRVGATNGFHIVSTERVVSIHAPVWVRPAVDKVRDDLMKFQFTHPCGCDNKWHDDLNLETGFNSRTRVGATPRNPSNNSNQIVSIHAPVWVRQKHYIMNTQITLFQFTHPCGCDIHPPGEQPGTMSFNSRTRVGATNIPHSSPFKNQVSIHAPVWVRRPDEYGLSIKHATKVLRQPDARTRCGQA